MVNALKNATPVPEVSGLSAERFTSDIQHHGEPVVIRQLVPEWPAVKAGHSGPSALSEVILPHSQNHSIQLFEGGANMYGRFFYSPDLLGFNFDRTTTTLDGLFSRLTGTQPPTDKPYYYAGAINIPQHMPGFLKDHPNPLLVDKGEMLVSAWIGTSSRIPLHWDLPENIACVTAGRRAFTLMPMEQLSNLYIGPLDRTIAGQPCSLVDLHDIDTEAFPKFSDAIPHSMYTELNPGDAIYIPSMWLHHVESLDTFGMLVNFWWREGPAHLITPMATMLHGLLSLKGMPARERTAWEHIFKHYLFGDQDEAVAHIPEDARGLWGNPTPEDINALRRMLASRLGS